MALRLPLDQARLLPRYRVEQRQARVVTVEEDAATTFGRTTTPRWKTPVGDDFQRLRGLPAVAPGVRGCQPGTDPVGALLRKEAYREKRR